MSNASIRESPQPAEAAISGSQLVTKKLQSDEAKIKTIN